MKVLLDTCTFLWLISDASRVSGRAVDLYRAPDHEVFLSAASAWAQDWAAWGGYGRFFGQMVTSSLRALNRAGARTSTDVSAFSIATRTVCATGTFVDPTRPTSPQQGSKSE